MGVTLSRMSTIAPLTNVQMLQQLINMCKWEVVVETFSCLVRYQTHSSAGLLASEWTDYGQRLSTARYTQSHRNCWDQVYGRELASRSISKQHLHLFSTAI